MINKYKKIILLFTLVIVITVAATILNIIFNYKDMVGRWMWDNLDEARAISKNIQFIIEDEVQENNFISEHMSKEEILIENEKDFLSDVHKESLCYETGIVDHEGNIIAVYPSEDENIFTKEFYELENISDIINTSRDSKKTVVSDVVKISDKNYGVFIASSIYSNRKYKGFLYRICNVSNILEDLFIEDTIINKGDYFVVAKDGTWLYSQTDPELAGKKYNEYIKEEKTPLAYSNYDRILNGDEFARKHKSLTFSRSNKEIYNSSILSVSPVEVHDKHLMSIGISLPTSELNVMTRVMSIEILIFILFILAISDIMYRIHKMNVKNQKERAILQERLSHEEQVNSINRIIQKNNYEVIKMLVKLIEMKDPYTKGHSERVTEYSVGFAKFINLSNEDISTMRFAATLHDIGKIGIPEEILNKKTRLTHEEFEKIKEHTVVGYEALKDLDFLHKEVDIILHHHERIDGKGYPHNLKREETGKLTKMLSICDAFDAMTSFRVYRQNMSFEEAFSELRRNSGIQFDETLVEEFIEYMKSGQT